MDSKELNFQYCESNFIDKLIDNNTDKKILPLHWSEKDKDVICEIQSIIKNRCDIVLSEILPNEIPQSIFKKEYDYVCERLIFIPPFKKIEFTESKPDKKICILYDDNPSDSKIGNTVLEIIKKEIDSIKLNGIDQFVKHFSLIASYERIVILLSNPVLSNLISYNLNLINRNHIIEPISIKNDLRYIITGLSNYLSSKTKQTSIRESIYNLLFHQEEKKRTMDNANEFINFYGKELKYLYSNKIVHSYDNKNIIESNKSIDNEFSINFIINILLSEEFIENIRSEIIKEDFYLYKIFSYIFNDDRLERRMYYINLLLEIKSDKISQYLLSFCEDKCMDLAYKDVHLFFANLLTGLSLRDETSVTTRMKSVQLAYVLITQCEKRNDGSNLNLKFFKLLLESIQNDKFNPLSFILENKPKQKLDQGKSIKLESLHFNRILNLMLHNLQFSSSDLNALIKSETLDAHHIFLVLYTKVTLSQQDIISIHENNTENDMLLEIADLLDLHSSLVSGYQSPFLESLYLKLHPKLFSIERFRKYNLKQKMIVSLIAKIAGENSIFEKCASHLLEILDSDSDKFSINLIRLLTAKQSENSCEVIVSKTTQCPHSAHECISMALIVLDANLSSFEHLLREASNRLWYIETLGDLWKKKVLDA